MIDVSKARRMLVCALTLASTTFPVLPAGATERGRVVRTERGACFEGPHDPMRVRRMTGQAATSDKPRNPLEDHYPHCAEASADDATGALMQPGRR